MIENVLIRTAVLADLELLRTYEQELINAERPFDPTIRSETLNYYDLEQLILDEEAIVLVAETEGQIISTGYGVPKIARHYLDHTYYAYLGFMFTHPSYRGIGINKEIIKELKRWAYSKELYEIRLTVYSDNLSAIAAYEKAGFKKHIIEMRIDEDALES